MVRALVDAGMDVARLNFSHGDHKDHQLSYEWVRAASDATGRAVGVLADYRFNKHFDTYAGGIYSEVDGGLSNGFLSTSTLSLTTGLRFMF